MTKLLIALFLFIPRLSYAQSQTCNCPPNEFGYPTAKKADTVFHLSNGRSIALCGYKETEVAPPGRTFYSEFVLAACGEKHIIKFWGAVLYCQLRVHKDTLMVENVDSLPTGKNMQYKWTVWTIERIYFKNGKAVKDFNVNRQIPKYNEQEIQSALKQFERMKKKSPDDNIEIADRLFISVISGSKQAREYLRNFRSHFGELSGVYWEQYNDVMRKLTLWDTGVVSDEVF